MFATLAVNKLEQYLKDTNSDNKQYNFMLGVGFKNPHLQVSNIYIYTNMCMYKSIIVLCVQFIRVFIVVNLCHIYVYNMIYISLYDNIFPLDFPPPISALIFPLFSPYYLSQIHIPYHYYDLYKNKTEAFKLTKKESRFPHSSPGLV